MNDWMVCSNYPGRLAARDLNTHILCVIWQSGTRWHAKGGAELEAAGTPIGAFDVLLAGQARRRGATLVTVNVREFGRVKGLMWEDWAAPRR